MLVRIVGDDAQLSGDRARELQSRGQQNPVRLVNLPGPQLLAGLAELGTRDEDSDARPLRALELGDPGCSQRSNLSRPEANSRLEDDVAGLGVTAAGTNVSPFGHRVPHLDLIAVLLDEL